MNKFKKPDRRSYSNPIESYNLTFTTESIIYGNKNFESDKKDITSAGRPAYKFDPATVKFVPQIVDGNIVDLIDPVSPFELLTHIRFKDNYSHALNFVIYEFFEKDIPYIRVRTNYFKRIQKRNNWGVTVENIVPWTKEAINDDYGKTLLKRIPRYDDFTIEPDNVDYHPVVRGCWNLYEPFPHKPHPTSVSIEMMPVTANFMAHVFGDQMELGYKYLKVLYENPKQILPVLVLVSKERATGKSSFLNWMDIIFGNNYTQIAPEDMHSAFNSQYAYRNIIGIDEAVIDKQSAVEKIKSIVTARTILVNQKMIAQYRIPFYGKIIITTNKETDFMRVDEEEVRFWVRKLDLIPEDQMTDRFYDDLRKEVPYLLRYLSDMEDIQYGKSRMVFTADELSNELLDNVKAESKSGLYKELDILITEWFEQNENEDYFHASLSDIKQFWFEKDSRISNAYIKKVLEQEMGIEKKVDKVQRYQPIYSKDSLHTKTGRPYKFNRKDFTTLEYEEKSNSKNKDVPF